MFSRLDVRIDLARSDDLDAVARVWHDSALHMDGASIDTPPYLELRARIDAELRNGWVLYVAFRGDRIVGMLAIKPAEAVLDQVFVLPEEQAKGVGRQLLNTAKSIMSNGFTLRMATTNPQARRFYERQGLRLDREDVHPRSGASVLHYRWVAR